MYVPKIGLSTQLTGSSQYLSDHQLGSISPRPSRGESQSRTYGDDRETRERSVDPIALFGADGEPESPTKQESVLVSREASGQGEGSGSFEVSSAFQRDDNPSVKPLSLSTPGGARKPQAQGNRKVSLIRRDSYRTGQFLEELGYDMRQRGDSNAALEISALTASESGEYVAYGDRRGRLYVLRRSIVGHSEGDDGSSAETRTNPNERPHRAFLPYAQRVAYCSVIDPLNSQEVSPKIAGMTFFETGGPIPFLLTVNEKVPKLWKVIETRMSPPPFRAVDLLGTRSIGGLTIPTTERQVLVKEANRYALDHEYALQGICCLPNTNNFATADDLVIRFWDIEHNHSSMKLFTLKPPAPEDAHPESFTSLRSGGPGQSTLFLATTTAGSIRLFDTRVALEWHSVPASILSAPAREEDGRYSGVTCSISSCDVSKCGRYVAARDFMTVSLWDLRMIRGRSRSRSPSQATGAEGDQYHEPVQRWAIHPEMEKYFESLYNSGALFDRFGVRFVTGQGQGQNSSGAPTIVTGSMGGDLIGLVSGSPSISTWKLSKQHIPGEVVPRSDSIEPLNEGEGPITHIVLSEGDGNGKGVDPQVMCSQRSTLHTTSVQ
jgi:hypothetical protein